MTKGRETKPHIGIFGKRNSGKSSICNALTGQSVSIVSDTPGTTTDPVKKNTEIPGVGAVVLIDTAGIDDVGELGMQRIEKTKQVISIIDLAILVVSDNSFDSFELELLNEFSVHNIPFIIIYNKSDIQSISLELLVEIKSITSQFIEYSAKNKRNTESVIELIRKNIPETAYVQPSLLGTMVQYGDIVLLVTPIDVEAPEGRLILPQVQAIRDILDNDCIAVVLKERELDVFLKNTKIEPKLVITDSQVLMKVDASLPKHIPLTGFSILLAHFKGNFSEYLKGTPKISELKDGDRILLLESCTHHVSCDDIGRVKIPRWLNSFTGKNLEYDVVAGLDKIERPVEQYALVIQCGGCMITRKQIHNRLNKAIDKNVPVTNYGMTIAYLQGVYNRSIAPFTNTTNKYSDYI